MRIPNRKPDFSWCSDQQKTRDRCPTCEGPNPKVPGAPRVTDWDSRALIIKLDPVASDQA